MYDNTYNNKLDYLIPELTKDLFNYYFENLQKHSEFNNTNVDTSPFLNMTVGVFIGTLINVLDKIKSHTLGEIKLMENIELIKTTITKAIEDLPFVKKIEFI